MHSKDLIEALKSCKPVFAPNQQSTYSNVNFELIGIALERATGMKYNDYMQEAIFDPLEMELTTIEKAVRRARCIANRRQLLGY